MKKIILVAIITAIFMLLLPLTVLGNSEKSEKQNKKEVITVSNEQTLPDTFRVYNKSEDKIEVMTAQEYIFGVVAAEMPALYEEEAIKAQAVAAYTYACSKRLKNADKKYDITTDYTIDQSFKSKESARKDWGSKADEYCEKIMSCIAQVEGIMLCYDNQPISAVYHAVSGGNTYSAKDVWGSEVAYLQSRPSEGDKLADNYKDVNSFTEKELKNKLSSKLGIEITSEIEIENIKTNTSGLVKELKINGKTVSGNDMRNALSLASVNFKYAKKDSKHIFTTYGWGHGVGMSQYGANNMAKQGYDYRQILNHFYTDCELKKG